MSSQTLKKRPWCNTEMEMFRNIFLALKKKAQQFGVLEHFRSTFITK